MAGQADLAIIIKARDEASSVLAGLRANLEGLGGALSAPQSAIGGLVDGLGRLGLAANGLQALAGAARGLGDTLGIGLVSEMEQTRASFMAFLKDSQATEQVLGFLTERAAKTPFTFQEMSAALATLIPSARQAHIPLKDLEEVSEVLAASHPEQGLKGAAFALREAVSGDFTSVIERFDLPRSTINRLKEEGVPNLEIVRRAMQEMGLDADLVAKQGETLAGRWSTFQDTMDGVKRALAEPIFNVLKQGLIDVQGFLDANSDAINGFASEVGAALGSAAQGFMDFAKQIGTSLAAGDVQGAFNTIIQTVENLATEFFGAGGNAVVQFAEGMLAGVGQVLDAAASIAADIAAFFIGQSPPPEGPLSEIRNGGAKLVAEYADAIGQADLGPIEDFAGQIGAKLTDIKGLERLGEQVEDQLKLIGSAIKDTQDEVKGWQREAERITKEYDDQLKAVQDQIDALNDVNDIEKRRAELADDIKDAELRRALVAAQGDPRKRAELQARLDELKDQKQAISLDQRRQQILEKMKDAKGKKGAQADMASLQLELKELDLQKQLAGLVDKKKVAEIKAQQEELKTRQEDRKLTEDKAKLEREIAELPLLEQQKQLKKAKEEALKPVQDELATHKATLEALNEQKAQWSEIQAKIRDALGDQRKIEQERKQAEAEAKKGAAESKKAAAAARGAPAAGGGGLDKILEGIPARAAEQGQKAATNFIGGLQAKLKELAPQIIGGGVGAFLGAAIGGPLGLAVGGVFGVKFAEAVQQKIPDIGERLSRAFQVLGDSLTTIQQVFAGDWAPDPGAIDPFTESVGELALFVKNDLIPAFQSFIGFLQSEVFPVVKSLATDAFNGIKENWPLIQQTVKTVLEAIKGFFQEHGEQIKAIIKGAWDFISSILRAQLAILGAILKAGMQAINGDWAGAWETIKGGLRTAGEALQQALRIAMEALGNIIRAAATEMVKQWIQLGTDLLNGADKAWGDIKASISGVLDEIQKIVSGGWGQVKSDSDATLGQGGLGQVVSSAWEGIKRTIDGFLGTSGNILTLVRGGWDSVKDIVDTAMNQAGGVHPIIKAGWEAIKTTIDTLLNGSDSILSAARSGWDNVKKAVGEAHTGSDGINQTVQSGWEGIKRVVGEALNGAGGVVSTVKNAAQTVKQDAMNLGGQILKDIQDGIETEKNKFKSFIEGIAALIPEWVRKILGIESPSKVFMQIGSQLMEGLQHGIQKKMPDVEELTRRAVNSISKNWGQGGLDDWLHAAMSITGVGSDWFGPLKWLAQHESGGDPTQVNPVDVGNGEHATGLMQTIPSTFSGYAFDGMRDIFNPIHNAVAAIRYVQSRYHGDIRWVVEHWAERGGYAKGGILPADMTAFGSNGGIYKLHAGEGVFNREQMANLAPVGGGGSVINVTVNVHGSVIAERDVADTVRRELIRVGRSNPNIFGGLA